MSSRLECERTESEGERRQGRRGGKAKERRVNKGNEGKFIYSLGSALRSSVKQKGLFSRDSSLSLGTGGEEEEERGGKMARNPGGNV